MSTINCGACGTTTAEATTTDVNSLKSCKIIIDNVPCYMCEECGETMYHSNVLKNIEKVVEILENDMGAIMYLDYEKCLKSDDIKTAF